MPEIKNKPGERYQPPHHPFVASTRAVKYAHEHFLRFKMGCVIAQLPYYPHTCNPDDVLATQRERHVVSWFCSDIQVRGEYPSYSRRFFQKNNITVQKEPGNAKGLRWCLNEIYDRYRIPLMVIENGLGAYDKKDADGKIHEITGLTTCASISSRWPRPLQCGKQRQKIQQALVARGGFSASREVTSASSVQRSSVALVIAFPRASSGYTVVTTNWKKNGSTEQKKDLCAQIPLSLRAQVCEAGEAAGQTTSEYITNPLPKKP